MLSSCLFHFHAIPNPFSRVVFFPDVVSSPFQGFISKSCASYEAIKTNPFSGCNIFAIIFKWFPFSGRGCFHPVSSTFMESQIPSQGVAFFPDLVSSPFQGLPFSGFHIQELCLLRCNQNKSLPIWINKMRGFGAWPRRGGTHPKIAPVNVCSILL